MVNGTSVHKFLPPVNRSFAGLSRISSPANKHDHNSDQRKISGFVKHAHSLATPIQTAPILVLTAACFSFWIAHTNHLGSVSELRDPKLTPARTPSACRSVPHCSRLSRQKEVLNTLTGFPKCGKRKKKRPLRRAALLPFSTRPRIGASRLPAKWFVFLQNQVLGRSRVFFAICVASRFAVRCPCGFSMPRALVPAPSALAGESLAECATENVFRKIPQQRRVCDAGRGAVAAS